MWETINNVKDGIWLNPKCWYNGCLVAKFRIGKGQTTISQESTLQVKNGGGNGSPLTHNGEGEEIVYTRWETKWSLV